MKFSETRLDALKTTDGLKLDIHIWEPAFPKAVLLAVHGGLAHAGDYVTPALFFKQCDIATVAYDLRGHKQRKVRIDSFEQLIEDTRLFLEWAQHHYPGLPVFYLGHSIGALIGTLIGLRSTKNDTRISGYIFSSPYYQNAIKANPFVIPMIKILSRILPNLPIPSQDITDALTHDETITSRHRQDETAGLRASKASLRFGSEVFTAQDLVNAHIQNWSHPIFAVVAGDDQVADATESERLLKKIDPTLLTYLFHPQNYHENFNEVNREETFHKISAWMTHLIQG
ncbi:MAG: lysophospholipase [Proteobacteria bacterium]|nr:lysophospholipase [Pseudomonadota bacterium]MBU1582798.1 lysophospholipase [Pseudomonadota bacterium]MBU2453314.1 lysophospholipase [Pseudomonadota bacterium]MBU2628052.1 lysophospholipase [Pseudomonadota bacterium]